ncbi:MAG: transcriptional regulator [Verrucomicrobia bacterium]|nr:transcriptional regulator [Verrucomicrobiota bacterium]
MPRLSPDLHFRRNLRALRLARSLTQEQLAEIAKADYKHLQLLELGLKHVSTLSLVRRLADVLKTKAWVLLCDDPQVVAHATGIKLSELTSKARPKSGRPATKSSQFGRGGRA